MTYHIFENDNGWTMLHYGGKYEYKVLQKKAL